MFRRLERNRGCNHSDSEGRMQCTQSHLELPVERFMPLLDRIGETHSLEVVSL